MDIGFAGALVGGLLTLLSPCSVMLLPAFFAYAFVTPSKLVGYTGLFYVGLLTTLVPLGIFSASLGGLVSAHRVILVGIVATLVILMGIAQLSGLPIPGLFSRSSTPEMTADRTSAVSVFFLGAVYAVAGVCSGPILGSVLMLAALGNDPTYGGVVLALYALGMVIPLFVLAVVWSRLGQRGRSWLKPRTLRIGRWSNSAIMIISGLLSVGVGTLLLLSNGTEAFGGFFAIDTQYAAESWVRTGMSARWNVWVVVAAIVVLAGVIGLYLRRQRRAASVEARMHGGNDGDPGSSEEAATAERPMSGAGTRHG
jgi:cytochrome c biogenesis protein CcdA